MERPILAYCLSGLRIYDNFFGIINSKKRAAFGALFCGAKLCFLPFCRTRAVFIGLRAGAGSFVGHEFYRKTSAASHRQL